MGSPERLHGIVIKSRDPGARVLGSQPSPTTYSCMTSRKLPNFLGLIFLILRQNGNTVLVLTACGGNQFNK